MRICEIFMSEMIRVLCAPLSHECLKQRLMFFLSALSEKMQNIVPVAPTVRCDGTTSELGRNHPGST